MARPKTSDIWVVVRRDDLERPFDPESPQHTITLREALPTLAEADAEAARLNALNASKSCFYFAAPVRWFPGGRDVEVDY